MIGLCTYLFEPASLREKYGDVSRVVSILRPPIPAPLRLLALQFKPSLSDLRSPEHPLFPFGLNPGDAMTGDARDRSLIGKGVLAIPPFVGPVCRSVGAQSTTQSWHINPLALVNPDKSVVL